MGEREFAEVLREAIQARGLGLDRIRERLLAQGVSVSLATLSYWQSGRSIFQPVGEALAKWNLTLLTDKPPVDDEEAPTAPGSLQSTGATSDSISLVWDAATDNVGVTGYDVLDGARVVASVAGTAATVTELAADTSYTSPWWRKMLQATNLRPVRA